jgi:hypothetical protein
LFWLGVLPTSNFLPRAVSRKIPSIVKGSFALLYEYKSFVELLGCYASLPGFILTSPLGKMEAGEPP